MQAPKGPCRVEQQEVFLVTFKGRGTPRKVCGVTIRRVDLWSVRVVKEVTGEPSWATFQGKACEGWAWSDQPFNPWRGPWMWRT